MNRPDPPTTFTLYVTNDKPGVEPVIIKTKHAPTDRETRGYDQIARFSRPNVLVWVLLKGEPMPLPQLQIYAVSAIDAPQLWIPWNLDKMTIGEKQL